ncbi:MAG: FAD-dependent oxidoreductase [Gallionellaceae bacterium]
MTTRSHRIVILGSGFAAVTAARVLRRRAPNADITLVAPKAEFVYLPSLIWVPTGLRKGSDLVLPLDRFIALHKLDFRTASVTGLKDCGRTIITDQGEIANDALLIATGGRFLKAMPGIEHALTLCEGVAAAEAIGERLRKMDGGSIAFGFGSNPREPSAMRGGPMFELLFGVETWLRQQDKRERFNLTFFNAATEPGKRLGEKVVKELVAEMQRRGIQTHLGHKIIGFNARGVETEGGTLPADLILFMPGLTGPAWVENSGLPISPGGFIQADEFCRVPGNMGVYAAGDVGSFPGPDWLPKQAHMADLQATAAAQNLLLELEGKPPIARPKVELMCIVDSLDSGILVYRDEKRAWMLPSSRLFHWAKSFFEGHYLRLLRK